MPASLVASLVHVLTSLQQACPTGTICESAACCDTFDKLDADLLTQSQRKRSPEMVSKQGYSQAQFVSFTIYHAEHISC